MVAAWIVRRYIASVTCVAILIVAIFIAATWAQFQALRRQHQWPIRERLMTMHDQRAIAFSTMHDARTVQRSNRASGMLESTIPVRCVYLCCSTACRTGERTILRTVAYSILDAMVDDGYVIISVANIPFSRLNRTEPDLFLWSHAVTKLATPATGRHTGPQPRDMATCRPGGGVADTRSRRTFVKTKEDGGRTVYAQRPRLVPAPHHR
jgi:uncharacterized MAPEG superfamily protein